ncbi:MULTISPECIES: hypothetical protein [Acinetobacter]|uniref:Uncharacterized protein n=1 Tax=Acinetobacter corruptisaponis TaxID=3045147 RepID=A0ABY8S3M7_9GAMM|nr:hypothetical protein [Acinetobacter sp. KCTC 92772]WHP06332.1 hypothetical protein QLH32_02360 [Acinetobacter sp. KCTC 92772]
MNTAVHDHILVSQSHLKQMIDLIRMASDVTEQLDVMCKIIEEKADPCSDIKCLAHVARCHAENWANLFDVDRESFEDQYFPKN